MKRKWVAALAAIAVCWPVASFAASLQSQLDALQAQINAIQLIPGPQGPTGATGSQGPQGAPGASAKAPAFMLTVTTSTITDGIISTAEWNDECVAMGGRAANSLDVISLPWDTAASDAPASWVRPYVVSLNIGGKYFEIAGMFARTQKMACGTTSNTKPWTLTNTNTTGLVAVNGATGLVVCSVPRPITCVVPIP